VDTGPNFPNFAQFGGLRFFSKKNTRTVGATCLLACGVQVWSTETVDGNREGQVETCRADGLGAVKDGREAWTEDQEGRKTDLGWLTLRDMGGVDRAW
jgi:hypothetical protein